MSHAHASDPREPDAHSKPSLLGLSMRVCEPELSLENVWHVMDVLEGSPAESAGLVPYGDWIIGWSEGVLSAEGDFYDVVESVRCSLLRSTDHYLNISSMLTNLYGSSYILTTFTQFGRWF